MEPEIRDLLEILRKYESTQVSEASALPPAAYRSDDLYALEEERVFRLEWLCVSARIPRKEPR